MIHFQDHRPDQYHVTRLSLFNLTIHLHDLKPKIKMMGYRQYNIAFSAGDPY